MTNIVLADLMIYSEDQIYPNGFIKIKGGTITEFGPMEQIGSINEFEQLKLPKGSIVIPGMIDVHIHGTKGADTMDATIEALERMASSLPEEGTTSFLATTITQEPTSIEKALINVADYRNKRNHKGKAELLGIHLEGPFINPSKKGAQPESFIVAPDILLFQKWNALAKGAIKLVTLAPEQVGGLELVKYLKDHGIVASIGHSDAVYQEVVAAIEAGASHVTHLFNGMRGVHHREPGVAGAALLHDELMAEIIVDGIHVHPDMVRLALKSKGDDRIILITDSMRAKCLKTGMYDLGGQEVTVAEGKALLADGTLAGSVLKMNEAARNMKKFAACSLESILKMTSENPAKELQVWDKKGSIQTGKDADLVVINEHFDVLLTLCKGKMAFKKEEITP